MEVDYTEIGKCSRMRAVACMSTLEFSMERYPK
jgi:hypothetical protein